MADMKVCDACKMEFDWKGVELGGYEYCCEACSQGEECTCPQHHHQHDTELRMNRAAAGQVGIVQD